MDLVVISIFLTTVKIYTSTATAILYVLPDNSTNAVSCPSQPCATLNQYVLDNGTLPVVSNVEYHFLPGEHHVPANMILHNLYIFSMIGIDNNSSWPVVLIGCSQRYVINIINSQFVTINNVMFKHCGISPVRKKYLTNLRLHCCFSCTIQNVTFFHYGILADRKFLLVKMIQFSQLVLMLQYSICLSHNNEVYSNYIHNITINQIFIHGYTKFYINHDFTMYHLNFFLQNSYFYNTNYTPLQIKGRYYGSKQISFTNCTFKFIAGSYGIDFLISPW